MTKMIKKGCVTGIGRVMGPGYPGSAATSEVYIQIEEPGSPKQIASLNLALDEAAGFYFGQKITLTIEGA